MSKERFKCYYCGGIENIIVEDTINNEIYIEDNIVNLLNQQNQRIAELEEQLKNVIVPKFNIGQEVWVVLDDGVAKDVVENNWFLCSLEKSRLGLYEDYLFATEEEARKRLEELKGEKK